MPQQHYKGKGKHDTYLSEEDKSFKIFKNAEIEGKTKFSEINLDKLIDYAEWFVKSNLRSVKTHQIRRFFDAIKNIKISVDKKENLEDKDKVKLIMLRPQLANASAKQRSLKELTDICTVMIKKVNDKKDFYHFVHFFESLVAFHKVYARE